MRYDRGDSFPFDFEPNGSPFGSKSKRKLLPRSYPIQFERKWKYSFLSAVSYSYMHDLMYSIFRDILRSMFRDILCSILRDICVRYILEIQKCIAGRRDPACM